jgi:hypothetical protein
MKQTIFFVIIVCFVFAVVCVQGADDQKPKMMIAEPIYNAGEVYRSQGNLEHTFVIKNAGTGELKILNARPG